MNTGTNTRELLIRQVRWEAEDVVSLRLECPRVSRWRPGDPAPTSTSTSPVSPG